MSSHFNLSLKPFCATGKLCACKLNGGGVRIILDSDVALTPVFFVGMGAEPDIGLFHASESPTGSFQTRYWYDDTDHNFQSNSVHYNSYGPPWFPGEDGSALKYDNYDDLANCTGEMMSSSSSVLSSSSLSSSSSDQSTSLRNDHALPLLQNQIQIPQNIHSIALYNLMGAKIGRYSVSPGTSYQLPSEWMGMQQIYYVLEE